MAQISDLVGSSPGFQLFQTGRDYTIRIPWPRASVLLCTERPPVNGQGSYAVCRGR